MGTGYALAAALSTQEWMKSGAAQLITLAGMAAIVFPRRKDCARGYVCMMACAALMAGLHIMLIRWLPVHFRAGQAAAVCAVLAVVFSDGWGRRIEREGGYVLLRIRTKTGEIETGALIDTGNTLRESVSGLPVIIVEERRMAACIFSEKGLSSSDFRKIRYKTLGGGGEMVCFKPESVCVMMNGNRSWFTDAWVALYPGELPGHIGALAPPGLERR